MVSAAGFFPTALLFLNFRRIQMKETLAGILLLATTCSILQASELITNGGFETGNLSGWTVTSQTGTFSGSGFFVTGSTSAPVSGDLTVGPAIGTRYAVSDELGPATEILSQSFTAPGPAASVILSFSLFVNSYGGTVVNPIGLDYTDGANQYARVDLLQSGSSLFTTGAGVLRNFYSGTDPAASNPNAYTSYSFDITSLVGTGGAFVLRFAEVDNIDVLNMGIDNVSVSFTPAGVPEPSALILAASAIVALLALKLRGWNTTLSAISEEA
jgi:hypothetical protein